MEIRNNMLISIEDADIINGKFAVPEEVTIVGDGVFENRSNLKELDTKNVEVISGWAFGNCKNLKKVNAPHLRKVGNGAFYNCVSLPCPNDKIRAEIYELALKYLNENELWGLCLSIDVAISNIIVKYKQAICQQTCFPLFIYENVVEIFGATRDRGCFWWPLENREIRREFLKWLYEGHVIYWTYVQVVFSTQISSPLFLSY